MGKAFKYAKAILRSLWRIERILTLNERWSPGTNELELQRQSDEEELGGDD